MALGEKGSSPSQAKVLTRGPVSTTIKRRGTRQSQMPKVDPAYVGQLVPRSGY